MSKSIGHCYECNEDYCESCTYNASCAECGADTCGEPSCISDCTVKGGCGDQICAGCTDSHDCLPDDEEDEDEEE